MRTEVSVKTRTEVDKNGDFLVSCFSDMNEDGTTTPVLFKSEVLSAPKIIDNTKGKEGEYYDGIGRGPVNLFNLPVFEDSQFTFKVLTDKDGHTSSIFDMSCVSFPFVS